MPRLDFLSSWKSKVYSAVNISSSPQARKLASSLVLATVALISPYGATAQTPAIISPSPAHYSDIVARSAALSPGDKGRAQQLFANAFSLWQSGDFAAAEIGFKIGLDIDPANATANYYYGDCLARRKDKTGAREFLARAVALGGMSVESLKARTQLNNLEKPVDRNAPYSSLSTDEATAALVGRWSISEVDTVGHSLDGMGAFDIAGISDGNIAATISVPHYKPIIKSAALSGDSVDVVISWNGRTEDHWHLRLKTASHMEGRYETYGGSGPISLDKL